MKQLTTQLHTLRNNNSLPPNTPTDSKQLWKDKKEAILKIWARGVLLVARIQMHGNKLQHELQEVKVRSQKNGDSHQHHGWIAIEWGLSLNQMGKGKILQMTMGTNLNLET